MITNLQFIAEDISFSVSELTTQDRVTVVIEDISLASASALVIELAEPEIVRLRDWLTEALSTLALDSSKTEAP